jgi:hypothetical protein
MHSPDTLVDRIISGGEIRMTNNRYRMTDEAFALFAKKYPQVDRSDVEEMIAQEMLTAMAYRAQRSEIEALKNKALAAMGTDQEMKFSDIESGMLRASLSDGRQTLKDIIESTPVEAPRCGDGTKMEDQGLKKKHHDGAGAH